MDIHLVALKERCQYQSVISDDDCLCYLKVRYQAAIHTVVHQV